MHKGFSPPPNQFQVYREGTGSYQYMVYPLQPQQLQELYPGQLMSNQWNFNGEGIPLPQGLNESKSHINELGRAALMEEEAIERHLGGHNPVVRHPAVAPESTIEDPDLRFLSVRDLPPPTPPHVRSKLPSDAVLAQERRNLSKLSREDSERADAVASTRENFIITNVHPFSPRDSRAGHPPAFVTPEGERPYFREGFASENDFKKDFEGDFEDMDSIPLWAWLVAVSVILAVIIGIIILIIVKR